MEPVIGDVVDQPVWLGNALSDLADGVSYMTSGNCCCEERGLLGARSIRDTIIRYAHEMMTIRIGTFNRIGNQEMLIFHGCHSRIKVKRPATFGVA